MCGATCMHAGPWALGELANTPVTSSRTQSNRQNQDTDSIASCMSGVELESPHAALASEKEQNFEIPGIGMLSTTWIGHSGRKSLLDTFKKSLETPTIVTLKKELKSLSSMCLKAFHSADMVDNPNSDVEKAIELCRSYLPKSSSKLDKGFSSVAQLWKEAAPMELNIEDKVELASKVLGDKLVDTIIERYKEPPDVSCYCCC